MKLFIPILFIAFLSLALFSCSYSSRTETKSEKETPILTDAESEIWEERPLYMKMKKVRDAHGREIAFTFSDSERTVEVRDDDYRKFPAYWSDESSSENGMRISFAEESPSIWFEGGLYEYGDLYIKDGWVYDGYENLMARNTQKRLRLYNYEDSIK